MNRKHKSKSKTRERQIVPGITLSSKNQATVSPDLQNVLMDLAEAIEGRTELPVDVEHVLASIVMGAQTGEIPTERPIDAQDLSLLKTLEKYVRVVFAEFGGKVGEED